MWLSKRWPGDVVRPETVIRWRRQGFRAFWTWRSRRGRKGKGRPSVSSELTNLIRNMALANPLWGAPRIHGELLKLGFDVSQRTVARLMPRRPRPPSQTWGTFLQNHLAELVSVDFFVVPTATFRALPALPWDRGGSSFLVQPWRSEIAFWRSRGHNHARGRATTPPGMVRVPEAQLRASRGQTQDLTINK